MILQDGTVTPCCLDYNGAFIVGDTRKDTIEEIWNGPVYSKLRENFKKLKYDDYPLCLSCNRIR